MTENAPAAKRCAYCGWPVISRQQKPPYTCTLHSGLKKYDPLYAPVDQWKDARK